METFSKSLNFRSRISTISNSYNFEWFIGLGLFESIIWSLFTFYLKYTTNRVFEYTRSPFKGPKIHVFGQFASYQLDYLTIFWYIIRFTLSKNASGLCAMNFCVAFSITKMCRICFVFCQSTIRSPFCYEHTTGI